MRLSAGRSTLAISTPVAAKTGSSHFKLPGRTARRGVAFRPSPNCEASVHVSWAKPWTLHSAFVAGSCAKATGPMPASRKSISNVRGIRKYSSKAGPAGTRLGFWDFARWPKLRLFVDWATFNGHCAFRANVRSPFCGSGPTLARAGIFEAPLGLRCTPVLNRPPGSFARRIRYRHRPAGNKAVLSTAA